MDKLHEASRKQFEDWRKKFIGVMVNLDRDRRTGQYICIGTWTAWESWQASRSSIVVEPPKSLTTREALDLGYMGDYAAGVDDGIEETIKVIRSIGLSIKGEKI